MLTIMFFVAVVWVTFKLLVIGIKAAWGIAKVFLTVLLFPMIVIGLFLGGLVYIAILILIVGGIVSALSRFVFE